MLLLVTRRLRNRLPCVFFGFKRSKNASNSSCLNVIPEKPKSHIRFGIGKVLSVFVTGVVIGGHIGNNISNLLEDYHLFVKPLEDDEEFED